MCLCFLSARFGASLLMNIDSGAPQPRRRHRSNGYGKPFGRRAEIVYGADIQSIRTGHCSPPPMSGDPQLRGGSHPAASGSHVPYTRVAGRWRQLCPPRSPLPVQGGLR